MLPFFIFLLQKMNIAIIGYGKMGKEIEKAALPKHNIVCIIDIDNSNDISNLHKYKTDVAIEFTNPEAAVDNIIKCFEQNIPIVTGTTGWYQQLDIVRKKCNELNGALFYAPNFSIGVNLYFYIIQQVAKILQPHLNQYCLTIYETHHTQKKDSPSGTAISMANIIMSAIPQYQQWKNYLNNEPLQISNNELPIISKRIDSVIGTHQLLAQSDFDQIIIEHHAKNRKAFALGAIQAAEFLFNKKGIYTMNDLLNINL